MIAAEARAASSGAEVCRLLITGHLASRSADYRKAAGQLRQFQGDDPVELPTPHYSQCPTDDGIPFVGDIVACDVPDDTALDGLAHRLLWPDRSVLLQRPRRRAGGTDPIMVASLRRWRDRTGVRVSAGAESLGEPAPRASARPNTRPWQVGGVPVPEGA